MMLSKTLSIAAAASSLCAFTTAQTFQRLGGCPTLGCVFPPDQYFAHTIVRRAVADSLCRTDFLAGQYFDIRLEVHAPVNGSQANGGNPDPNFTFTIAKGNGTAQNASTYFKQAEPKLERWNFTWFEGTDPLTNSGEYSAGKADNII